MAGNIRIVHERWEIVQVLSLNSAKLYISCSRGISDPIQSDCENIGVDLSCPSYRIRIHRVNIAGRCVIPDRKAFSRPRHAILFMCYQGVFSILQSCRFSIVCQARQMQLIPQTAHPVQTQL